MPQLSRKCKQDGELWILWNRVWGGFGPKLTPPMPQGLTLTKQKVDSAKAETAFSPSPEVRMSSTEVRMNTTG